MSKQILSSRNAMSVFEAKGPHRCFVNQIKNYPIAHPKKVQFCQRQLLKCIFLKRKTYSLCAVGSCLIRWFWGFSICIFDKLVVGDKVSQTFWCQISCFDACHIIEQ
ncbi:hypothetical protein S83_044921 [Arachis hypogaea]